MGSGILALLLVSIIGGAISPTFVKLGTSEIPPLIFTGLRFLIATTIFLPIFLREKSDKPRGNDLKKFFFLSLFFVSNVVLFSYAIERTTVIMSQIIYAFVPLAVAIFSVVFLKETVKKNQVIGGLIAFVGLALLIFSSVQKQDSLAFGTTVGNVLCMIAVVSWAAYLTYSRKLSHTYSPKVVSFYNFFFALTYMILLSPLELHREMHFSTIAIISIIVTGVISSAAMIFLVQYGIKKTSAITAALFNYTAPFFASIAGVFIFKEKLTLTLIIGGLLIISGVFFASTMPLLNHVRNRRS